MASKNDRREQPDVSEALIKPEPMDERVSLMTFGSEEELLKDGFETEIFHKIGEGDSIFGLFVGRGDDIELREPDPVTGEVIVLPCWKVRGLDKSGHEVGVTMLIPGKHELNRFFRSHTPGNTLVGIKYAGRTQIGQRQVTRFITMSKPDTTRTATGPAEVEREKQLKAEAEASARAAK
jgi:hypothetical protein